MTVGLLIGVIWLIQAFVEREYNLVLMKGITDIIRSFQLRALAPQ